MKRWIAFAGILFLGIAAVVVSERRKVDVSASPAALLYLVADTEQELTRMPVRFTRMSDADEIRIGDELAKIYATQDNREETPEVAIVEHYLTRVGDRAARNAHRKLPYKFHYLPDPYMVNAFALPGGHVFVGGGLLTLMDSEDELAAVLGHEIEHIDHYHCAERVQREEALRHLPLFGDLLSLPIEVFEAGYTKDQELEADREGTRLSVDAGYSANGAIRMFEVFQRLYEAQHGKAKTPEEELSQLAQQSLEGYFRSHPLPSERIAQVQQLIASEGWTARPERDLAVAYIFWTAKAQQALSTRQYARAEQLANQSLRLRPGQPKAFQVLAVARLAQANFSGAADAYRQILEIDNTSHPEIITAYAQALAAADRKTAAAQFRQWADKVKGARPREMDVASAGVELLAGNPEPSRTQESEFKGQFKGTGDSQIAVWMAELGWWHYLAEDYPKALDLLSDADQLRPGHWDVRQRMAWTQIEMRRYSDALNSIDMQASSGERMTTMVRAVVHWRAQEQDDALRDLASVLIEQPEWENPAWVKGLYSPAVAQDIQQMLALRKERAAQAAAKAAHR